MFTLYDGSGVWSVHAYQPLLTILKLCACPSPAIQGSSACELLFPKNCQLLSCSLTWAKEWLQETTREMLYWPLSVFIHGLLPHPGLGLPRCTLLSPSGTGLTLARVGGWTRIGQDNGSQKGHSYKTHRSYFPVGCLGPPTRNDPVTTRHFSCFSEFYV